MMSFQNLLLLFLIFSKFVLLGVSFSIIYRVTRFFHFAHGAVYIAGAYGAFVVVEILKRMTPKGDVSISGMVAAALCGIIVATALGAMMELCIYRPLRNRSATPLVLLIASMGMYVIFQNVISVFIGNDAKSIRTWPVREGLEIFGARITPAQIVIIVAAIVLVTCTHLVLKYTRIGTAMRALASNRELSSVVGIDSNSVILFSFILGSALCGAAGVLSSLDLNMTPTMGMNALLMGVVVAIVGGISSLQGIIIGALLLAVAQQVGGWYLPIQWQNAIAFGILLVFLLIKPSGVLGARIKKSTI